MMSKVLEDFGKEDLNCLLVFLTRFSTKILVTSIRLVNGGRRAGGRILNGVKPRFPLNNFSLLWPIDVIRNSEFNGKT